MVGKKKKKGVGTYKMRTFSQLTGFSPAVLRAWERRHGLLDPERLEKGHRLYTEDDRLVMQRVRDLLEAGRAIGEIALIGRDALKAEAQRARPAEVRVLEGQGDNFARHRDEIIAAARRLDPKAIRDSLDQAFLTTSPTVVVQRLITPLARAIGDAWQEGTLSVASEHMVSAALGARVQRLLDAASEGVLESAPVVCACAPEEYHQLGLMIVALGLSNAGIPVVYLGAAVPLEELERTFAKVRPRAVCISVGREERLESMYEGLVALTEKYSGRPQIHVGGHGVTDEYALKQHGGLYFWPPSSDTAMFLEQVRKAGFSRRQA